MANLRAAAATHDARTAELKQNQQQLRDAFEALSSSALRANNEQFLHLARTELDRKEAWIENLVAPIRDGLDKYAERIAIMAAASDTLRGETANLAKAMRSSNVRGAWGELQLKRAVELAGMLEHCDFELQHTVAGDEGLLRPDMIVRLPGDRTIVVDAKTPATSVLEAINCADDAQRRVLCAEHVVAVRRHIDALSKKSYWEQFDQSPEFVVMFLPSEAFFSVALEFDPSLFEHAFEQKVVIATPTTLIALLKAVAFGWRQEAIARNAQEISDLGRELYERIKTLGDHFDSVGNYLGKSVLAYNRAVVSLERRVLPAARKFQDLGVGSTKRLAELTPLEVTPAALQAPELEAEIEG